MPSTSSGVASTTRAPAGFMKVMVKFLSISMIGVGITLRSVCICRSEAWVFFSSLMSSIVTRVPLPVPFIGTALEW